MNRGNKELWIALLVIILITAMYVYVVRWYRAVPAAGSLFGHIIGVIGFLLMLATETLYSYRKRSRNSRWGAMNWWLQFHIFTGLVGPYMVLLHGSWEVNGLAGATMLLTVIIVISGFIGRYIYTQIPRTLDGAEVAPSDAQVALLTRSRRMLAIWHSVHIP